MSTNIIVPLHYDTQENEDLILNDNYAKIELKCFLL